VERINELNIKDEDEGLEEEEIERRRGF